MNFGPYEVAGSVSEDFQADTCLTPHEALDEMYDKRERVADQESGIMNPTKNPNLIERKSWYDLQINDITDSTWASIEIQYPQYTTTEEKIELLADSYENELESVIPDDSTLDDGETVEIRSDSITTCTECEGDGVTKCGTCDGTGVKSCPQQGCSDGMITLRCDCTNGYLNRPCSECHGKSGGLTDVSNCTRCNSIGNEPHDLCNTTGRKQMGQCQTCSDSKPLDQPGMLECNDCTQSDHTNQCQTCEGAGETYQATVVTKQYYLQSEIVTRDSPNEFSFDEHKDSVVVNESVSERVPDIEGLRNDFPDRGPYTIKKKILHGYRMAYSFLGKEFDMVVVGQSVYGEIPTKKSEITRLGTLFYGIAILSIIPILIGVILGNVLLSIGGIGVGILSFVCSLPLHEEYALPFSESELVDK